MRIRFTLDIERARPPENPCDPPREVDMGAHVESLFDERIGFRANTTDLDRGDW